MLQDTRSSALFIYYFCGSLESSSSNLYTFYRRKKSQVAIFAYDKARMTEATFIISLNVVHNSRARAGIYDVDSTLHYCISLKSVNLQLNTLGRLDDGTNESSTKRLMFHVLFFS